MATESITHAFHFEGEAALRFANAVEESLKGPGLAANLTTEAVELRGEELKEFLRKTLEEHEKRKV